MEPTHALHILVVEPRETEIVLFLGSRHKGLMVRLAHSSRGLWAQAVSQAGTTDVNAVRQAMYGQRVKAPSGFEVVMNTNHHLSKPAMIGKLEASGAFDVVSRSISPIKASVWSRYLPRTYRRLDISMGLRRLYRADLQGLVIV